MSDTNTKHWLESNEYT